MSDKTSLEGLRVEIQLSLKLLIYSRIVKQRMSL